MGVLGGWAFSYEPGTPVRLPWISGASLQEPSTILTGAHPWSPFTRGGPLEPFYPRRALGALLPEAGPSWARCSQHASHVSARADWRKARYRGTSLIRNSTPLGPYGRPMPRALWRSWGGERFLMSEVPLYAILGTLVLHSKSRLQHL